MAQLDLIDKQILSMLATDCRTPYREIAKALGMSATAIKGRVDDLVENNIITDFVVELSPSMANSELLLGWLTTDKKEDQAEFIKKLSQISGMMQIVPLYGGDYLIFAEYITSLGQAKLIESIKTDVHVTSLETHTLLGPPGQKIALTNLQLRVLKPLLQDARMQISDIARASGLTVRVVRRTLREIKESGAIRFSLRWRLNVGDRVAFLLKLRWNHHEASRDEIVQLIASDFQDEFWIISPSATESFLIGVAIVDNLNMVDTITTKMRALPQVTFAEAFIYRPPYNFKSVRRQMLEELIQEQGV